MADFRERSFRSSDAAAVTDLINLRLGLDEFGTYFAMARGTATEPALELTTWFATNDHDPTYQLAECAASVSRLPSGATHAPRVRRK